MDGRYGLPAGGWRRVDPRRGRVSVQVFAEEDGAKGKAVSLQLVLPGRSCFSFPFSFLVFLNPLSLVSMDRSALGRSQSHTVADRLFPPCPKPRRSRSQQVWLRLCRRDRRP
jgi:hypothetical protein